MIVKLIQDYILVCYKGNEINPILKDTPTQFQIPAAVSLSVSPLKTRDEILPDLELVTKH